MALPGSGSISLSAIQTEFGGSNPASLSEYYRGGSYVTINNSNIPESGGISFSNFYGGTKIWSGTVTTNQTNFNVYSWATSNGYSGSGPAQVTIASGVYIYSTGIYTAGLSTGVFPSTLYLINKGYIMGMGGTGGGSGTGSTRYAPLKGSRAVQLNCNTVIDSRNGYILGGGGGGGTSTAAYVAGGGGAGGGAGGRANQTINGGAGSGPGSSGGNGSISGQFGSGGGGGRVVPGSTTTGPSVNGGGTSTKIPAAGLGGSAGGSGSAAASQTGTGKGGDGGGGGNAGGNGAAVSGAGYGGGGGGGWGAAGGNADSTSQSYCFGAAGAPAVVTSDYFTIYGAPVGGNWTLTWYGGFPSGRIYGSVI